jgi:hypothetical protein
MKKIYHNIQMFLIILLLSNSSCKKFLNIDPPKDSVITKQLFENDQIATSAITGIYSRMSISGAYSGGYSSIATLSGLSADELINYYSSIDGFYNNNITSNISELGSLWSSSYSYIYAANAIIEGLNAPNGITENTMKQLRGEAKFVRAFCYFYLVNLFGDVPLHLSTDYRNNELAGRTSKEKVYTQIVEDLIDAETILPANYVTIERVRPNKWAAKSLLSRVYLFTEKWDLAALKATEVIEQKQSYSLLADLDKVFLKNSIETIWQIMPSPGNNTDEGALFVLNSAPFFVSLSPAIISTFESGDNRRTKWISEYRQGKEIYYYPYKYKISATTNSIISEYSTIFRLAELHLIRAEARAKMTQTELSLEDINLIRKRAGLISPLSNISSEQCLAEVEKQRRLELFTEWGHRWLDLKRTGRTSAIIGPLKGSDWVENDKLYPIPDLEIMRNPTIIQNPGY